MPNLRMLEKGARKGKGNVDRTWRIRERLWKWRCRRCLRVGTWVVFGDEKLPPSRALSLGPTGWMSEQTPRRASRRSRLLYHSQSHGRLRPPRRARGSALCVPRVPWGLTKLVCLGSLKCGYLSVGEEGGLGFCMCDWFVRLVGSALVVGGWPLQVRAGFSRKSQQQAWQAKLANWRSFHYNRKSCFHQNSTALLS